MTPRPEPSPAPPDVSLSHTATNRPAFGPVSAATSLVIWLLLVSVLTRNSAEGVPVASKRRANTPCADASGLEKVTTKPPSGSPVTAGSFCAPVVVALTWNSPETPEASAEPSGASGLPSRSTRWP